MGIDFISKLRQEYGSEHLKRSNMAADPLDQFKIWFEQALEAQVVEPNAMTLATVNAQGHPTIRVVLLKDILSKGLVFYTNYQSRKAQELQQHPQAALNLFWQPLERQVRIEGVIEKLPEVNSDDYFKSRPRGSQLGAWVSPQSQVIPNRGFLEEQLEATTARFENQEIPRPPHWGGYILIPQRVEFWQGGAQRLHDRIEYLWEEQAWNIRRLAP